MDVIIITHHHHDQHEHHHDHQQQHHHHLANHDDQNEQLLSRLTLESRCRRLRARETQQYTAVFLYFTLYFCITAHQREIHYCISRES